MKSSRCGARAAEDGVVYLCTGIDADRENLRAYYGVGMGKTYIEVVTVTGLNFEDFVTEI